MYRVVIETDNVYETFDIEELVFIQISGVGMAQMLVIFDKNNKLVYLICGQLQIQVRPLVQQE